MDNAKQTPEGSHVRSREAAEALHDPIENMKRSMVASLGGTEKGAHYIEYPPEDTLRIINVKRSDGNMEGGWAVVGEAVNDEGGKINMVGRLDEKGLRLAKPATPEQIIDWNTPETRSPAVIEQSLGHIGLRLADGEAKPSAPLEVVDAPVEQLDKVDKSYDYLFDPDYDDGLTDQQRIEAAAFDPRSEEEKSQDAWDRAAREADHKYNLARQTERIQDGGN